MGTLCQMRARNGLPTGIFRCRITNLVLNLVFFGGIWQWKLPFGIFFYIFSGQSDGEIWNLTLSFKTANLTRCVTLLVVFCAVLCTFETTSSFPMPLLGTIIQYRLWNYFCAILCISSPKWQLKLCPVLVLTAHFDVFPLIFLSVYISGFRNQHFGEGELAVKSFAISSKWWKASGICENIRAGHWRE